MARSWTTSAPSPDDAVAEAQIQERLRMARALRDQSMQGVSLDNVGGHLIGSPVARALSSGLDSFAAGQQEKRAMGDASALAQGKRDRLTAALAGAGESKTPDDMISYGTRLLNDPATAEVGQFYITAGQRAKERAAAEAAQQTHWQQQETTAERRHREALEAADHRSQAAINAANARAAATPHNAPLPASSIQEMEYLKQFDPKEGDTPEITSFKQAMLQRWWANKRAQQVLDRGGSQDVLQPGAAPGTVAASLPKTLAPDKTPEHAFEVAGAKKQGEAAAGLAAQQAKAPGYLSEAESLLGGEQKPTGSRIGAAADAIASMFGATLPGAAEASQLEAVGGYLTSLAPRFEGPQSDRDTQIYREMAGQIGNRNIPVPQRQAALKTVKKLIMGYGGPQKVFGATPQAPPPAAAGAPAAPPPVDTPPPPGVDPEDWKYLSPEERAAFGQ